MTTNISKLLTPPGEFDRPENAVAVTQTATGAIITVNGIDYVDEDAEWGYALRIIMLMRPYTDDGVIVDAIDCQSALIKFVDVLGSELRMRSRPSFVAALEGSIETGLHYTIILNLPHSPPDEAVFKSLWCAWPNLAVMLDVMHETSGIEEVQHLLGRTRFYCRYHRD